MDDPANTEDELGFLMEHLGERTNRVFAYFYCALEFEGDEDMAADPTHNDRAWKLQTIKNACLDTTLIALRDLDDFLRPMPSKKGSDDIRASRFGYPGDHSFLARDEREKINKLIAHITSVGAASHGFRWDVLEMATKGISQIMQFLEWTERRYGLPSFELYSAAAVIRRKTLAQMNEIVSAAKRRKENDGSIP